MGVQPLAIRLSTVTLSLIFYYLNILSSLYRLASIQLSTKLHIICKVQLSTSNYLFICNIIYKLPLSTGYYLQVGDYLQGLLRHRNSLYQQGPAAPTLHYKY